MLVQVIRYRDNMGDCERHYFPKDSFFVDSENFFDYNTVKFIKAILPKRGNIFTDSFYSELEVNCIKHHDKGRRSITYYGKIWWNNRELLFTDLYGRVSILDMED